MTNPTPHGQVPAIQRYKIGYHSDEWGVRSSTPSGIPDHAGAWVRYEDHLAALAEAQQPATHVQQSAEIEHVAGDVSKNGAKSNVSAQQAAPSAQADSVTAPARPSKPLPYEPTSAMLIAARERDPALPIETVRAIYWSMWRTAPTPPAQAAGSVLEDAARYRYLRDGDWREHEKADSVTAPAGGQTAEPRWKSEDFEVTHYPPMPTTGMRVGMPKGVKVTHRPTGLFAVSEDERSQHMNREVAWNKLQDMLAAPTPPAGKL